MRSTQTGRDTDKLSEEDLEEKMAFTCKKRHLYLKLSCSIVKKIKNKKSSSDLAGEFRHPVHWLKFLQNLRNYQYKHDALLSCCFVPTEFKLL